MLVTNILLCFVIVVLFCILDRLGDIYYAEEIDVHYMTAEEAKRYIEDLEDKE